MKNGNVREFVDHIYYGDELWFLYEGKKYFLEGWMNDGRLDLCLYEMADNGEKYIWKGSATQYPVEAFWKPESGTENLSGMPSRIWNG